MFFDFGGFGGHQRHREHHHHQRERVEEKDYYGILGVEKDIASNALRKAYRRCVKKYHPDRFTDPTSKQQAAKKFKEVQEAYEVLKDEKKRAIYDKYGVNGLRNRLNETKQKKGESVKYELEVSLSELYNGAKKKIEFERTVLCDTCNGEGCKKGARASKRCDLCSGNGVRIVMRQLGPFITKSQAVCSDCDGNGVVFEFEDLCTTCGGNKVKKENKKLDVFVERGMENGQKIVFHGEADQQPNSSPGDIIVVLQQKEDHQNYPFKRIGPDLVLVRNITLCEALTGYSFKIRHLDGRLIEIQSIEGDIVNPDDIRVVEKEGMPQYKNPFNKGKLFIKFQVQFPEKGSLIDEPSINSLKQVLSNKINDKIKEQQTQDRLYQQIHNVKKHMNTFDTIINNNDNDLDIDDTINNTSNNNNKDINLKETKDEVVICKAVEYTETKEQMRRRRREFLRSNNNNYDSDDDDSGDGTGCRFQ